jgi:hypothetical protein
MDIAQTGDRSINVSIKASITGLSPEQTPAPLKKSASAIDSNLSNISTFTESASALPDIRNDAIEHARLLINDPNWLSDQNLDSLASKIAKVENL